MVQWLGLGAFTARGPSSIPGQETKIPQAYEVWPTANKQTKRKEFIVCNEEGYTWVQASQLRGPLKVKDDTVLEEDSRSVIEEK